MDKSPSRDDERFNETLKRMLETPPKSHQKPKYKEKPSKDDPGR